MLEDVLCSEDMEPFAVYRFARPRTPSSARSALGGLLKDKDADGVSIRACSKFVQGDRQEEEDQGIRERKENLVTDYGQIELAEFLNIPFEKNRDFGFRYGNSTRFSDGTWPVFYSALDIETAFREVWYHFCQTTKLNFHVHYILIKVSFCGFYKDITDRATQWPFLLGGEDSYRKCQDIGKEASEDAKIGALQTLSVRNEGGVNKPVFKKECLLDPVYQSRYVFHMGDDGVPIFEKMER